MNLEYLANNAVTTLAGTSQPYLNASGITNGVTSESWCVASTALPFPQITTGQEFRASCGSEILTVTGIIDSTHFQVTRACEGSSPGTHSPGDAFGQVLTLAGLQQFIDERSAFTHAWSFPGAAIPAYVSQMPYTATKALRITAMSLYCGVAPVGSLCQVQMVGTGTLANAGGYIGYPGAAAQCGFVNVPATTNGPVIKNTLNLPMAAGDTVYPNITTLVGSTTPAGNLVVELEFRNG